MRIMTRANHTLTPHRMCDEVTSLEDTNQRHQGDCSTQYRLTPPNSGPTTVPLILIIILEDHGLVERLDPASAFSRLHHANHDEGE
jgi:hypothetical protein